MGRKRRRPPAAKAPSEPVWQPFREVKQELKALLKAQDERATEAEPESVAAQAVPAHAASSSLQLSEEDLFAMSVGAVEPLASAAPPRARPQRPWDERARAERRDDEADFAAMMDEQDLGQWQAGDTPERLVDDLRTGALPTDRALDLHGLRTEPARRAVAAGLAEAKMRGLEVVLFIHGKGLRSGSEGDVLRQALRRWLRRPPLRNDVLAYAPAPANEGGSGATRVLVRQR